MHILGLFLFQVKLIKKTKLETDENAIPGIATSLENKRKQKAGPQQRKVFKTQKLNRNDIIYPHNYYSYQWKSDFAIWQGDSKIMLLHRNALVKQSQHANATYC